MTSVEALRRIQPAVSILDEAMQITNGPRRKSYGHPRDSLAKAAKAFSAVLHHKLTADVEPHEVGLCMIGLKICREASTHKRDNLVDVCGYARTVAVVHGEEDVGCE